MQKKRVDAGIDFVKWFSELNKNSGPIAGGKGANLGEIYNAGIPVPNGFVITAQAYNYFIEKAGIKPKIMSMLSAIDYENTDQLNSVVADVKKLIIEAQLPEELKEDILDAYETLGMGKLDLTSGSAKDILNVSAEPVFVAVRSSATSEDLAEASFAGQQETFLNTKGNDDLLEAVKKCFASLFTPRATYYRNKTGFKHESVSLAVVVQKMVQSDKSGVIFSKSPSYNDENIIIEAVYGLGEGIVSGQITPDHYLVSRELKVLEATVSDKKIAFSRDSSGKTKIFKLKPEISSAQVLKEHELRRLADLAIQLEIHYGKPQDIEFAIEKGEVFIVQTRPITTIEKRIESGDKGSVKDKGDAILSGLAASPGVASGVVKIIHDLKDLDKIKTGDVLVTEMTNPDMVVSMQKSSAIITDEGGLTAHAAIVSREMGIPCVVGTRLATQKLKDGDIVTVDGYNGKVYMGATQKTEKKEIMPVDAVTKTKIKVIVDLPDFAERAAKSGIRKVGLTRIEGIIAESGKHPNLFLNGGNIKDYEDIIFKGITGIAKYFDELWIRTSDIRTDEYQNLEGAPKTVEANPMLGMHGIRFSLKYPAILKAELNALKRVAESGKTIGVLMPQVILVEELQAVKKMIKEIGFEVAKVGIMIETPAAVQLIKEFCEEGIDFISFGTNDLTQYMLAIDRGNEAVQSLYNEMHPAILRQMEYVIRTCKRYEVESSICGQSGSKKEMVKFLVETGIDSISVNADMAKEISDYVAELEKGTDKDMRDYEKHKEKEQTNLLNDSSKKPLNKEEQTNLLNEGNKKLETYEIEEDIKPLNNDRDGCEDESVDSNDEEIVKDVDKAVSLIEKEKQDYIKKNPSAKEDEDSSYEDELLGLLNEDKTL